MILLTITFAAYIAGIFSLFILKNKDFVKQSSLFFASVALVASSWLFIGYDKSLSLNFKELYSFELSNYFYEFSFGLDGLSTSFTFLSCFLIFLCILFIWEEERFKEYSLYLLLIGLFLVFIFTVQDILMFYIFFEAILIPMFLVIGIWGSRERKIRAVYMFFFYTLVGSLITLLGILYIYATHGTLSYEYLSVVNFTLVEQKLLWIAFFLSFASKIPMFPLHIWLPEAHVEAPTVGSVLLAGILLKLGVYGLLRFNLVLFIQASYEFAPLVYSLCVIGVIYASLTALRQTDLKRIIAYSSIAHMNLVVAGIFSFNAIGYEGAVLQSISHGFVSGGLFLLIGIIYSRYHTRFLHYYGGIVHFMPLFASSFLFLTLANIALPGTGSFVGEFLLLLAIYKTSTVTAIFTGLGVILSGAYSLWLYNRVAYGNIKVNYTLEFKDLNSREAFILLSLVIFVLIMGISPNIFIRRFSGAGDIYFFSDIF